MLKTKILENHNIAIFYLEEDIDIFVADKMRTMILNFLQEKNIEKVILNCKDVSYVDSSGMGLFLKIRQKMKNPDYLRFCEMIDSIAEIFSMTNLIDLFHIDKTEDESIAHLTQSVG